MLLSPKKKKMDHSNQAYGCTCVLVHSTLPCQSYSGADTEVTQRYTTLAGGGFPHS